MKLIKLSRKKSDTHPNTLRDVSAEECQQVAGGGDATPCGICTKFSTTPKTGNPLPSCINITFDYKYDLAAEGGNDI